MVFFIYKDVDMIPEGETVGACADQLNSELHKRNCRYGRCEQIRNGTDFICHCNNVIAAFDKLMDN